MTTVDQFFRDFPNQIDDSKHFTGVEGLRYSQAASSLIQQIRLRFSRAGFDEESLSQIFLQEDQEQEIAAEIHDALVELLEEKIIPSHLSYDLEEDRAVGRIMKKFTLVMERREN